MSQDKIFVTKSSIPELAEYVEEIRDIWDSHWLTNMGRKHELFKQELKRYLEIDNVELLVNGHMAIEMALQAFAFPLGSEVITTPFTFASTTHAIVRNGLTPVFADINDDDYTINVNDIEKHISENTVAILPVHVYGNICDVNKIESIANKHGLKVIYDAAHSFGETYKGIGIGNFGDVSCFSFHATKVFNSIEGGAVSYKSKSFGDKIYDLKNFGIHNAEEVCGVGANAKMNEFCAAMGLCNLRHIDDEISKRRLIYERYISNLEGISGLKLNHINDSTDSNYAYFPIVIDETKFAITRNELVERLEKNNIIARKYFYPLVTDFDCYKKRYDSSSTPIAKYISDRVVTLPLYAELKYEVVDEICDIIISGGTNL